MCHARHYNHFSNVRGLSLSTPCSPRVCHSHHVSQNKVPHATFTRNALHFEAAHSCLVDAPCPPLQSPPVHTGCLSAKCPFAHDQQCATSSRVPFTNFLLGVHRSFSAYSLGHQPSKGTTMVDASFPPVWSPLSCLCQSLPLPPAERHLASLRTLIPVSSSQSASHQDSWPSRFCPSGVVVYLQKPTLQVPSSRLAPKHAEDETPAPNYNRQVWRRHPFAFSCREEGPCLHIKLGFGPFAHHDKCQLSGLWLPPSRVLGPLVSPRSFALQVQQSPSVVDPTYGGISAARPSSAKSNLHLVHNPMAGKRIGEAAHPGPQTTLTSLGWGSPSRLGSQVRFSR